jgi:hypothetical protein
MEGRNDVCYRKANYKVRYGLRNDSGNLVMYVSMVLSVAQTGLREAYDYRNY